MITFIKSHQNYSGPRNEVIMSCLGGGYFYNEAGKKRDEITKSPNKFSLIITVDGKQLTLYKDP